MNKEFNCDFVSSRGILKSCDITPRPIISSISRIGGLDGDMYGDNNTLYMCITSLPFFVSNLLPGIKDEVILVTGDGDESISANTTLMAQNILNSGKIKKWYSQNQLSFDPRIEPLPIGLDYHTMKKSDSGWGPRTGCLRQEATLKKALSESKHFSERKMKCYVNYHQEVANGNSRKFFANERTESLQKINHKLIYFENANELRDACWKKMTEYAFVLSPPGNGWDCHRTWEALCLGCIPIVRRSGMRVDELFDDLPVLLVDRWEEVTEKLLTETVEAFALKDFNMEKLKLKYWIDKIHE